MVIAVHGGPGTPGYMAPLAKALADSFRVLEPFQRRSGHEPLTVDRHVSDLHELMESACGTVRPALVGHSWGAMLALAYTAQHPDRVGALVLVGCGTFDRASRNRMQAILAERMTDELSQRLAALHGEYPDPDQRLSALGKLMLPLYSYRLITEQPAWEGCDARGHHESWADMIRLQETDVFPPAFAPIDAPAIMLHGADDPHPGRMIWESLKPILPQLEYQEWKRCGHYPWLEVEARDNFTTFLRAWLVNHLAEHDFPTPAC
jgi:pimeloyl-ACP methyl ester carboxylesterase